MTVLEEGLIAYLRTYSGLTALISTRTYGMMIPQQATLPCLVVTRVSTARTLTHQTSGATGDLAHPRFQFDAWAETQSSTKAISDQLRAALNGKQGNVGSCQTETATVAGTIVNPGNATVIVTAAGMTGSAITLNVAVLAADSATAVATKIKTALDNNGVIAAFFVTTRSDAVLTLTRATPAANDVTMNISINNGTCSGLTAALTSTNTLAGLVYVIQAALVDEEVPTYEPEAELYRCRSEYIVWHEEA